MQLKPDCVRDTLLFLEENLTIDYEKDNFNSITLAQLTEQMMLKHTNYNAEDIWYTVYNLHKIRFIEGRISNAGNHKMMFCDIENITWNGHQFLNTIRPTNIWEATKQGASKLGLMSMNALSTISMEVMKAVVANPTVITSIVNNIN